MFNPRISRGLVVASFTLGFACDAQAADCGFGTCWGAVALGERGATAQSSGHRTAPDAWARADRVCRGKCDRIEVFHSGCGAIVQGGRNGIYTGFAEERDLTLDAAVAACSDAGHRSCRVRVWACSH